MTNIRHLSAPDNQFTVIKFDYLVWKKEIRQLPHPKNKLPSRFAYADFRGGKYKQTKKINTRSSSGLLVPNKKVKQYGCTQQINNVVRDDDDDDDYIQNCERLFAQ